MVKKNDTVTLTVEALGIHGEGIAHVDGQVVFVAGALPGEVCRALVLKVGKSAAWAKAVEIQTPSPARREPSCPYFPKCGGCQFRHMSYEAELEAKRQRVADALERIGGLSVGVEGIVPSDSEYRYRNKAQLPLGPGPKIGFFRARSHDVIDVEDCLIQPQPVAALRRALKEWMARYNIPAYDEASHSGLARHLYVRFATEGALVCLVVNGDKLPHEKELVEALRQAEPTLAGVVLSINRERTNVILGKDYRTLWGKDYLEDTLCGLTFRLSAASFYQVNHAQAEKLYALAVEWAGLTGKELALDLYCGTGTISLVMAKKAGRVMGCEIVPQAVADARTNARRNGIDNAEFFLGDAAQLAAKLAQEGLRPDVITVDPPRKGLDPSVVEAIAAMAPTRVVYVSCDPATLARDLKELVRRGYEVQRVKAVDMFPRTGHVETVVLLSRA